MGVQLTNPSGIHIFEEGGQLRTILFLPLQAARPNLLLYVCFPNRGHLVKGHIGKGPDMLDYLLEACIMVIELHQATHCDPFLTFTIHNCVAERRLTKC